MGVRPTTPEAGAARLAASDMRFGRRAVAPSRRLGVGVVASLSLHAGAAAAVAAVLAWRTAPVALPPEAALQVVWLDARPPAEPDPAARIERTRPLPEAASPAAPIGENVTEGLEPEDLLATMLPDPVVPPPPADAPGRAEAPLSLSELMAAADLPAPEPPDVPTEADFATSLPQQPTEPVAAPADRNAALAALAVPSPAPPPRAAPSPASPPSPAKRERSRPPRPPNAAAAPARPAAPSPAPSPPRAEGAAFAPPPVLAQPPLVQGPPRFRRPPSLPYPEQARDRGEEGSVGLRLLVGADGAVREVRLHRSSGNRLLDEAALAAARRWEVEPASIGGQRTEAWFEAPVRFRLDR